jgi:hypothetical protein
MTWNGQFEVQESSPGEIRAVAQRGNLSGSETAVESMELRIKLDPNAGQTPPQVGDTITASGTLYQ